MGILDSCVAIVTGTESGIGLGVAQTLAECGAAIVESGASDPPETADSADVLVRSALAEHGRLNIVVHAAHQPLEGPLDRLVEADWDTLYRTHVRAAFCLSRAAAPVLKESGAGRIITISSAAGLFGAPGQAAFAAATDALAQFSRLLAVELASDRITSNCIVPTAATSARASRPGTATPGFDHPQDLAPLIAFLCSDKAASISGQTFLAGGGIVAALSSYSAGATVLSIEGTWSADEMARVVPAALGLDTTS